MKKLRETNLGFLGVIKTRTADKMVSGVTMTLTASFYLCISPVFGFVFVFVFVFVFFSELLNPLPTLVLVVLQRLHFLIRGWTFNACRFTHSPL